jgi:hypothetical protein
MIVRTWSGSYIELNRQRILPWLLGWLRLWFRRRDAARPWGNGK